MQTGWERRIHMLAQWGEMINGFNEEQIEYLYNRASGHNNWFTKESVTLSLQGIIRYLKIENLEKWISGYRIDTSTPKRIGLVMAGNIPLAGFHDFLAVLVTGNIVEAKLSSQDPFLLPYLAKLLLEIEPGFNDKIFFVDRLKNIDAIIATGSDNTARYFHYYFSKYPHIIRKNRTSCAILTGEETKEDLRRLGKDVFQYFGLGCRNVSKLYLPQKYDFNPIFEAFQIFEYVKEHHKYANNYDYNKSIFLVNGNDHLDSGFLLLLETEKLVSPISVLFYESYQSPQELERKITFESQKIQCIVSKNAWWPESIEPGTAQTPDLWDYADKVDTIKFLTSL